LNINIANTLKLAAICNFFNLLNVSSAAVHANHVPKTKTFSLTAIIKSNFDRVYCGSSSTKRSFEETVGAKIAND